MLLFDNYGSLSCGEVSIDNPDSKIQKVVVSARVHPGENPASFAMEGFLRFLINAEDQRAILLRQRYIFYIIPMINIDGVINGYQRTNINGINLNRAYHNPNQEEHPIIFAIKQLIHSFSDDLMFYFDFHAHARSRGCFFYGNYIEDDEKHTRNLLFASLAEHNHPALQFRKRNFKKKLMSCVDKNGESRSGSGRVQIWEITNRRITHCYTIECNYHCSHPYVDTHHLIYTPSVWRGVGEALAVTILDIDGINPESEISKRDFQSSKLKVRRIVGRRHSFHI